MIREAERWEEPTSAVVPRCSSKETRLLLLSEAVAVALNHECVTVMEEPIEDRGGEDVVAEDRTPLRDDLIGGDQQAAAIVPAGNELEKEVRAASFKRQVAEARR